MTKKEVQLIKRILERIKDPDKYILESIAVCDKQIAIYTGQQGQLKEQYEDDRLGRI